jgi:hypothetical protein
MGFIGRSSNRAQYSYLQWRVKCLLGYWVIGLLGYWVVGLLRYWVIGRGDAGRSNSAAQTSKLRSN